MAKLYGYVRVSTEEQTVDLQVDALLRAGVAREDIYADEGVSGTKPALERAGFAALVAAMRDGDALVVYSISRVGRSSLDVLALLKTLEDKRIGFRSVTEPFDTTTHAGKLVTTILAACAEMERSILVERTKAGVAAARARGARVGRPPVAESKRRALAQLVSGGMPVEVAARELGLGAATAYRIVSKMRAAG